MKRTNGPGQGVFPGRRTAAAAATCAALVLGTLAPAPLTALAQGTPPVVAASTQAQPALTLREAAQQAVLNNPEVLARWHAVKAAAAERDAAAGALRPKVDLSASGGPERRTGVDNHYERHFGTLTLTQLLWDGLGTQREIDRLDFTTRTRVYELINASESAALEAARAYFDVLRYRELVKLAEDNFVEHRTVFAQTDARVKAKVARAVDLEQITGRLALAEANLLIETANLHDTTARYQRIVGNQPPAQLAGAPVLAQDLPDNPVTALTRAQSNSAVLAAIASVQAADAALQGRASAYQPRLDFRLRRDNGRNIDGIPGATNVTAAEVLLRWNLYDGMSDRARERQFAEQLNVAKDIRDKTCRDVRQTTMIAYNDVVKLKEQLEYLGVHASSLERALTAYRQQFQVGQRTLLDLLDTDNELFQARRAQVNARYDLATAYVRTQAGVGNLLRALELTSLGVDEQAQLPAANGADGPQQCPPEPVALYTVNKDALVQRALQQAVRTALPSEAQRSSEAPAARAVAVAPAAEPAVRAALEDWRAAWARGDVAAYLADYAPAFVPAQGGTRAAWERKRRDVIGRSAGIAIALEDVKVTVLDDTHASSSFRQQYRSSIHRDTVEKTLEWERVGGRWLIVRETAR